VEIKSPPEKPLCPVRLFVNGCPPVYTPPLKVKINPSGRLGHVGTAKDQDPSDLAPSSALMAAQVDGFSGTTSEGDGSDNGSGAEDGLVQCICKQAAGKLQEYEDENQHLPSEDSASDIEDEEVLTDEEINVISQATKLAREQDEVPDNLDGDSEDSDSEDDENGEDSGYVPNAMRGKHSTRSASKTMPKALKAKPTKGRRKQVLKNMTRYEFCPLPHHLSILHLLVKHFCQHPLLPECHGQTCTTQQIHHDSVYESYLHCQNNGVHEVWAYLWTNWYAPDKWKLWARSAHPLSIPWKHTTMLVEAMWQNFK